MIPQACTTQTTQKEGNHTQNPNHTTTHTIQTDDAPRSPHNGQDSQTEATKNTAATPEAESNADNTAADAAADAAKDAEADPASDAGKDAEADDAGKDAELNPAIHDEGEAETRLTGTPAYIYTHKYTHASDIGKHTYTHIHGIQAYTQTYTRLTCIHTYIHT